jgi:tetratricopeptide (TPR) repeat protein
MILLLLFMMMLSFQPLSADPPEAPEDEWFTETMNAGIDAYYRTDWDAAKNYFDDIKKRYPKNPRPYFFESMMPFMRYFFIENSEEHAEEFLNRSEKALELSHQQLEDVPTDTTMVLMLSGLYGYRGLVAAGQDRHQIAIRSGLRGFQFTRKLLSLDSDRPDARIGKGMFYYMVGSVPDGMKWAVNMLGYSADKETGFNELKAAAQSDSYIRNDALMMLMYLYHKEENLDEALYFAEKLTESLPENLIFRYKKAKILEEMGRLDEALSMYNYISSSNNLGFADLREISSDKARNLEKITERSR